MLLTVEGTYRNAKVELTETPTGIEEARVLVTFLTLAPGEQHAVEPAGQGASEEVKRRVARERLLARMKRGYHLGGGPYYRNREELYDRVERYSKSGSGY